jgi:hypothetical protein
MTVIEENALRFSEDSRFSSSSPSSYPPIEESVSERRGMALRALILLSRLRNPKDEDDDDDESYFWNCERRVPLDVVSSKDFVCGIRSGCC